MTETRADYTPSLGGDAEGNESPDWHDGPPDGSTELAEVGSTELAEVLDAIEARVEKWYGYSFTTHARDDIRTLLAEVRRLQALLEAEQRARWQAEQDCQHWREKAEALQTQVAQLAGALEMVAGLA